MPRLIRPLLSYRLIMAAIGLGVGFACIHRGLDRDWSTTVITGAVILALTLVCLIETWWFHYYVFARDVIYRSHWFGLLTASVRVHDLTSIDLGHVATENGPITSIHFAWNGGVLKVSTTTYGESWIQPVVRCMQVEGVRISEGLLKAMETDRYDPPGPWYWFRNVREWLRKG
jgi:hypothetical protein